MTDSDIPPKPPQKEIVQPEVIVGAQQEIRKAFTEPRHIDLRNKP